MKLAKKLTPLVLSAFCSVTACQKEDITASKADAPDSDENTPAPSNMPLDLQDSRGFDYAAYRGAITNVFLTKTNNYFTGAVGEDGYRSGNFARTVNEICDEGYQYTPPGKTRSTMTIQELRKAISENKTYNIPKSGYIVALNSEGIPLVYRLPDLTDEKAIGPKEGYTSTNVLDIPPEDKDCNFTCYATEQNPRVQITEPKISASIACKLTTIPFELAYGGIFQKDSDKSKTQIIKTSVIQPTISGCPEGYDTAQIFKLKDYPNLSLCYRNKGANIVPSQNWGGYYIESISSNGSKSPSNNPLTGSPSCPNGFNDNQFSTTKIIFHECARANVKDIVSFGGMTTASSTLDAGIQFATKNPTFGTTAGFQNESYTCPTGFISAEYTPRINLSYSIYGTTNQYFMRNILCYKIIDPYEVFGCVINNSTCTANKKANTKPFQDLALTRLRDSNACLNAAKTISDSCKNPIGTVTTASYIAPDFTRTDRNYQATGCMATIPKCLKHPKNYQGTFRDINLKSNTDEKTCLGLRGPQFAQSCGFKKGDTATFEFIDQDGKHTTQNFTK